MSNFTVRVAKWTGGEKVVRFSDPRSAWDFAYKNYLLTRVLLAIDQTNAKIYGFTAMRK